LATADVGGRVVAGGRGDVTAGGEVKVGASTGAVVRVRGRADVVRGAGGEVVAGGRADMMAGGVVEVMAGA
jgi:hypothetical protein